MSNEVLLLLAAAVPLVLIGIAFPFVSQPYRRASKGLDLIGHSKISPVDKMALLNCWRSPAVTREQYEWLVKTIADLEKEQAA